MTIDQALAAFDALFTRAKAERASRLEAMKETAKEGNERSDSPDVMSECLRMALTKILNARNQRLIGLRMLMEHFNKVRTRPRTIKDRLELVGIIRRSGLTYEGARYGFPAVLNDERLREFLRGEAA